MQKPEASIAIQVVPKAPNNEEAVRIIDAVIAHLKGSGLPTYVGPFETSVEGAVSYTHLDVYKRQSCTRV